MRSDVNFNPLDFVINIIVSMGNFFYDLWIRIGAWDLLYSMLALFVVYRLILQPIFGGSLNLGGSDRVQRGLKRVGSIKVGKPKSPSRALTERKEDQSK